MKRTVKIFLLILGLVAIGPVEELQAIVGHVGPGSVRGQARRVSRRTARRTTRRVNRRHDAAYAAAATTVVVAPVAGLAIGTRVSALPTGCASVTVNSLSYFNCGGAYYQPQYSGATLVYTVVVPPL